MSAKVTRYNFQTNELLEYLQGRLKEVTGVETFCGERPTNNSERRKEMLVVSLPYSVRQKGAVQTVYLRIEIIVKDKNEGRSNLGRLEDLANALMELFPMRYGRFDVGVPNLVLKGKDTIGFTIWNLQGNVMISKLDTYSY